MFLYYVTYCASINDIELFKVDMTVWFVGHPAF